MIKSEKELKKTEAVAWLRCYVKRGSNVYISATDVSSSRKYRRMKVFIPIQHKGKLEIWDITRHVADVLDYPRNDTGIRIRGIGMDSPFALVYILGCTLYPDPKGGSYSKQTGAYALNKENL